jgi:hypothetical protein
MPSPATTIPPRWQEWYEERAAILEYEAGLPRAEAEAEALRLLRAYAQKRDPDAARP